MTQLKRTDSDNKDFRHLVVFLDQELKARDGDEHDFYNQFNKIDAIKNVVVCFDDDIAIGCGAFKPYDNDTVEIKRMYVLLEQRSRGIAGVILKELEKWAKELKYTGAILETGKKQPEAIRLYQKSGYQLIPNFGQYEGVENSVCMQKEI